MTTFPFPAFVRQGLLSGFDALRYRPTNEWLFPSPILAEGRFQSSGGRWALYYSPHDFPGGICLAWADSLAGPWREHPENPVISNVWPPHYQVTHVASPHPLWMEEEGRLFLWYHGENDTTRLASSSDGVHFDYESVAMDSVSLGTFRVGGGCYYGRVFRCAGLPGADRYAMLAPGGDPMDIYVATSPDARAWTVRPAPLLRHPEGCHLCSPFLWEESGRQFIFYHCDICDGPGDIRATEVSPDLRQAFGMEVIFPALGSAPDDGRVGDPCLVDAADGLHLFYTAGRRLKGRFAYALARRDLRNLAV
jgi:hypothetical protein